MDFFEFKDNLMYGGSSSQSRLYIVRACFKKRKLEEKEGELEGRAE